MSGLINFIKGLFSGIFGFLGGLLGSKKKASSAEQSTAQAKSKKSSNGFFLELEDAKGVGSKSEPNSAASSSSGPKESKPAAKPAAAPAKPAAPEPAAKAKALNMPQPTVTTFAPNYLLTSSTNGRRRPGANMSSFLDMARQVKVPNQG